MDQKTPGPAPSYDPPAVCELDVSQGPLETVAMLTSGPS